MLLFFTGRRLFLTATFLLAGLLSYAQTTLSGSVSDAITSESLAGVNIAVKGKVIGTVTDTKGRFSLTTTTPAPFTILVSSVGYETQEIDITGNRADLQVKLTERATLGEEVIVSASRVEESVLKSSASVEKMSVRDIQQSATPSFYDAIVNLKGVESSVQSLMFRSINTRGFNSNGNVRMVQLIDGMDNQAPGLNFPVGNIVGMSELDVESVELLPGASSALYGPNAINGILLMNSKSPFRYQGLSATVKTGLMHLSDPSGASASPFYDASVRYAKSFNDRFAFKVNLSYLRANDWQAANYADLNANVVPGSTRETNPNYNGVNVMGDETSANIRDVANQMVTAGVLPAAAVALVPSQNVSRTGFLENQLADYTTKSLKANIGLHYRLTNTIEALVQANYGSGTTVYTGSDRYSIKNFNLGQYKAELRGDNFFLRAYTTQERSGESYANGILGQLINEAWGGGSPIWFPTFVGALVQARSAGQDLNQAYQTARGVADKNRPVPGSTEFNTLAEAARKNPIPVGAKFLDKTNLYHYEGMYNFKNQIKFAEIIVGASHRVYQLNSDGTLFADKDGRKISIKEYGAYAQVAKSFGDVFKLTGSLRYDKSQFFEGQFTPRLSGVLTVARDHNIRLSYQSAFRIPTTQDQFIDLKVPQARLIGGLPEFRDTYNLVGNPIYSLQNVQAYGAQVQAAAATPQVQSQAVQLITGRVTQQVTTAVTPLVTAQVTAGVTAQVNAAVSAGQIPNSPAAIQAAIAQGVSTTLPGALQATISSEVAKALPKAIQDNITNTVTAIAAQGALGTLKPYQFREYKPERVQSFEIGYKSLIKRKLFIDGYVYFNTYRNFSSGATAIQVTPAGAAALTALGAPKEVGLLSAQFRQVYQFPSSSEGKTLTYGWALGLDYALSKGYTLAGNVSVNKLKSFDENILNEGGRPFFNTPDYRFNLSVGKRPGLNGIGFNVTFRQQPSFVWQSSFVNTPDPNATVVPAFGTLDAQVSKKIKTLKSILKVGASNLLNTYYYTSYGNPSIGGQYFISLTFDEFLN
ncbi:MAG: TonB-dependent receptor [Sphingobacteriaceae bacterium]|nr:TonB-dependent receptor [Cytophagaceae bacterium]